MSNRQRHILLFLALLAPAAAFATEFDGSMAQTATLPEQSELQQATTPTLDQSPAVTPCPEIVALQNPNLSTDELAKLVNSKLFRISYEMQKLQNLVSQAINPAQKAQLMKEFTALKNLELEIVETYQAQMRLKVGNVRPIRTSAFNRPSTWQKLAKKFKSLSRRAKLAAILTPIGILLAAIAGGLAVVGGRKLPAYVQTRQITAAIAAAATRQQAQDRSEQARIAAEITANHTRASTEQAQDHYKHSPIQAAQTNFNAAQARYDAAQQAPNRDENEVKAATSALAHAEQALEQARMLDATKLAAQQAAATGPEPVDQATLPHQRGAVAGLAEMTPVQDMAVKTEIAILENSVQPQVAAARLIDAENAIYSMLKDQQLNYLAFLNFVRDKRPAAPVIRSAITFFCNIPADSQSSTVHAKCSTTTCNTIVAQCTALRSCGHPICQDCLGALNQATNKSCGFSGCSIPVVV